MNRFAHVVCDVPAESGIGIPFRFLSQHPLEFPERFERGRHAAIDGGLQDDFRDLLKRCAGIAARLERV